MSYNGGPQNNNNTDNNLLSGISNSSLSSRMPTYSSSIQPPSSNTSSTLPSYNSNDLTLPSYLPPSNVHNAVNNNNNNSGNVTGRMDFSSMSNINSRDNIPSNSQQHQQRRSSEEDIAQSNKKRRKEDAMSSNEDIQRKGSRSSHISRHIYSSIHPLYIHPFR